MWPSGMPLLGQWKGEVRWQDQLWVGVGSLTSACAPVGCHQCQPKSSSTLPLPDLPHSSECPAGKAPLSICPLLHEPLLVAHHTEFHDAEFPLGHFLTSWNKVETRCAIVKNKCEYKQKWCDGKVINSISAKSISMCWIKQSNPTRPPMDDSDLYRKPFEEGVGIWKVLHMASDLCE